ncbi:carbohydrate-binding-like fold isoform X2 [Tasmannia lanceolata]|uniref:carbohydrate-binding-like fold isoform X1 n=1 Tax=Tasmannia lanceolata TaxID=3420 RepID=UPI004062D406
MELRVFLACLLIAFSVTSTAADSIQGCGGFVEARSSLIRSRKPSDGKLDYSHITVELQTVDGLIKDRTQCAPNGYYFIPVYDKGSFIIKIKGPEGWSWDPDNVPVVIDHNGCNGNADINFRFTGFTISGRVIGAVGGESCSLKHGGPSNVQVELLSLMGDLISSVHTSSVGGYSFTNVIPGKYNLRASHPNLKVELKGSPEVELGFGNSIVDDIFFVPGYDIYGSVVAQGNPILGVHLYLYSDDVVKVDCPQGTGSAPRQKNVLCHAVSDAEGKFTFNSIPCGTYELLPYYKGENTVFDISPPSMKVSVEHRHVTIAQKFQVTGFSVGGRVVDGNYVGVEGVKILVDGHVRSTTDSQGYYKLDQVTSKHYTIVAEKDHYKFNSLQNFLVLPSMASVADIEAAYYDICGVVRLISTDYKAKVTLTHGPENVKPQMKQTDENGSFCFEVPPGEYRLSALSASLESASGLVFLPPFVDVIVNSPLLDIEFSQAQVDIHGTVLCREKCGPSISVTLIRSSGRGTEERAVSLTHESSDFMFPKVFPGKYRLEVKHESPSDMSEEDNWCWEQSAIDVDVGTEDKKGIVFIQNGYWVTIISTHGVDSYIRQPDASLVNLLIKKGSQKICVESPGLHELHFVNSCICFGSSSIKFDTFDLSPIYLTGKRYLLRGEIHIDSSLLHGAYELSENIIMDILNQDHAVIGASHTRLTTDGNEQTGTAVYEYSIWADLGDELIFVPRDSRNTAGKKFLFYPRLHNVSVTSDGCQATIPPFVGRLGLYMEGSVSPALSGVDIRIVAAEESSNAPLQKGELALETKTGSDGFFIGGPLYDDTSYNVEASKPGYHLKSVGPNSFSCQKLSQVSVHIYAGEEVKELFPSVLLSLSGEDGYRNNSVTAAGGSFLFDNLFPGSFYLRPLLKEYSFSPPAQAIELGSGESKEVIFHATRVAYSAMGTVSLLSGQPKEGIFVEARSESKGYYEETTTDSSGNFRLRGLLPDTTYLVKVVAKEDLGSIRIERASPEFVAIEVGMKDIKGLDFVVFEEPEVTILSGHVEGIGLEKLQPHLSVEVKLASDPSKIVSVFPLPLSYYFQIRDLPKVKHLVKLHSGLPSSIHKFESEIIEVDLERQSQIHVGPLRFKVEDHHHKQELTPAPVFPLIIGVSVIALFISMPRLKDLYQSTIGMTPLGSTPATTKKEVRKPIMRKRTY